MKKGISVVLVPPEALRTDLEYFREEFSQRWRDSSLEILITEEKFRERLQSFESNPFDLAVFGVYIPFCRPPAGEVIVPQEVKDQGYHRRAGFRCRELLHAIAPKVPVVVCDVFDAFGPNGFYHEVRKLPANSRYLMVGFGFERSLFPLAEELLMQRGKRYNPRDF